MNTKIVRKLNLCLNEADADQAAKITAKEITESHNSAVSNGFLELPMLDFDSIIITDHEFYLTVRPSSGYITANDIYNLQTAWGADELNVYTCEKSAIELVFRNK